MTPNSTLLFSFSLSFLTPSFLPSHQKRAIISIVIAYHCNSEITVSEHVSGTMRSGIFMYISKIIFQKEIVLVYSCPSVRKQQEPSQMTKYSKDFNGVLYNEFMADLYYISITIRKLHSRSVTLR